MHFFSKDGEGPIVRDLFFLDSQAVQIYERIQMDI